VGDGDLVVSFVATEGDAARLIGGEGFVCVPCFGEEAFPDFSHWSGGEIATVEGGLGAEVVCQEDPVDVG